MFFPLSKGSFSIFLNEMAMESYYTICEKLKWKGSYSLNSHISLGKGCDRTSNNFQEGTLVSTKTITKHAEYLESIFDNNWWHDQGPI